MKFYLILILSFFIFTLHGFIDNVQYESVLHRTDKYEATFLSHNNKLYVDACYSIEQYDILENGTLELTDFIPKPTYSLAEAQIIGDSLYVISSGNSSNTQPTLYVIDISGESMQLVNTMTFINNIFSIKGNNNYLFLLMEGETEAKVYDRINLNYIRDYETGAFFHIEEELLFMELFNYTENNTILRIENIEDINNPQFISNVNTGSTQQNLFYYFLDNYLFILRNRQIIRIDMQNMEEPNAITYIDNIPGVPDCFFLIGMFIKDDYLVFKGQNSDLWIYNISNINDPQFISHITVAPNSGSVYKSGLCLFQNYFYYSSSNSSIKVFDASSLPELNHISDFGTCGKMEHFDYFYPYLFFYNSYSGNCNYLKINEPCEEPELIVENSLERCNTDNEIYFLTDKYGENGKVIKANYDENQITLRDTFQLNYIAKDIEYFNGFLVISSEIENFVKLYSVEENNLTEIEHFTLTDPNLPSKDNNLSNQTLYITHQINGETYISVYNESLENVYCSPLDIEQQYFDDLFQIGNNKVVLERYSAPNIYKLCDVTYPFELEILDTFNSFSVPFLQNDSFFTRYNSTTAGFDFIKYDNDEFEIVYELDYDPISVFKSFHRFFKDDNNNKLYFCSYNYINQFSFDSVSALEDDTHQGSLSLTNYPNPFRVNTEATTIKYNLPRPAKTKLSLYNIKGQKIKTLINKYQTKGEHTLKWNGRDKFGKKAPNGIYLYKLQMDGETKGVKKCVILK